MNETYRSNWGRNSWEFYLFSFSKSSMAVTQIDENHLGKATAAAAGIVCPCFQNVVIKLGINLLKPGQLITHPHSKTCR